MNCKNAKLEGEMIRFDCPSYGVDADLDEATLDKLWLEYQGQVTCPLPQGCNTQYTIPTKTELDRLRTAVAMGLTTEIEPDGETAPSEPSNEAAESELEPEPEKPKFTGPFRYESKSDKEDSNDDEFDQVVARNREQKTKPQSPLAIRTFRRIDCIHQGKDCFDDTVSEFLGEIGKENIISVTPATYMEKLINVLTTAWPSITTRPRPCSPRLTTRQTMPHRSQSCGGIDPPPCSAYLPSKPPTSSPESC
jgi:hypothetical protein